MENSKTASLRKVGSRLLTRGGSLRKVPVAMIWVGTFWYFRWMVAYSGKLPAWRRLLFPLFRVQQRK